MITALICLLLSSYALVVVLKIRHEEKWGKFETPNKKTNNKKINDYEQTDSMPWL